MPYAQIRHEYETQVLAPFRRIEMLEAENKQLRAALELIAMGTQTSSGDLAGATWEELRHVQIARDALKALAVES
jgi:hypothetical protein